MPDVVVIGGANGAGKSTFVRYILPNEMPFLNADEIARALPADYEGNRELESGRQLLRRMDSLAAEGRSFAVETTLASRSLAPRLRDLQSAGYTVSLFFFFVPTPDLCVERVASRVRRGGHDIPEPTIRRRFNAGLQNFLNIYAPLADEWRVLQNTDTEANSPLLIAEKSFSKAINIKEPKVWSQLRTIATMPQQKLRCGATPMK